MKDHQLKALLQVAECGSIRAAARNMNLSQSALTKALRELEEDVGAELLLRSYKGIEFTDAGMTLLSRARLALSALDKAREEIRLMRGGAGAHVEVAITPLVATTVLPEVLAAYSRTQPDARLTLHEGLLVQALPGLVEGRLDFAIALASPEDLPYDISFEPLTEIGAVAFARSTHPLAGAQGWQALEGGALGAQPQRRQPEHGAGRMAGAPGLPGAPEGDPLFVAFPDPRARTPQ